MLQKGDKAPYFEGPDQDGNIIRLSDFAGRRLVLYFYPKDSTPGCTAEACDLRDNYQRFLDLGYAVVGVSKDSTASHQKFIAKYGLPFPLISDPETAILQAYEAWGEKKNYGKVSMGTLRKTYVIDENGVITDIISKVDRPDTEIVQAIYNNDVQDRYMTSEKDQALPPRCGGPLPLVPRAASLFQMSYICRQVNTTQ